MMKENININGGSRREPARAPSAPVGRPKGGPTPCLDVSIVHFYKCLHVWKIKPLKTIGYYVTNVYTSAK